MQVVGIRELLLQFGSRRIDFHRYARLAQGRSRGERPSLFFGTEIDKQQLGAAHRAFRVQLQVVQHIIDTVCPERNPDTRYALHPENPGQIVVTAASADAAHRHIQGLDLEDGPCIIVQSPRQAQIQFMRHGHLHFFEQAEQSLQFFYPF